MRCYKNGKICDCCESDLRSVITLTDNVAKESQDSLEDSVRNIVRGAQKFDATFLALLAFNYGVLSLSEKVKKELSKILE